VSVLVEVPVAGDASVLVEMDPSELPGEEGLTLATPEPGVAVAKASQSLEESLERLDPVLGTLKDKLTVAGPDHFRVEFGVKLGGETGIILAKGTAEVSFTVTMAWDRNAPAS
jgi:NTP-dependent ternary system trypsin peptidase co-occuring protein